MRKRPLNMSPSAIAKREKYAAAKAAKQQAVQSEDTDSPVIDQGFEVEVAPNEAPKLSLKDRLFGGSTPPAAGQPKAKTVKKGQRGKQIDSSLLAKTFPTIVATTAATYAQRLIHDPYKPCAPSQQEIFSTIGPLFSILSRRIEIVGSASEDIIDLISALLAGIVSGIRIHITYLSISEAVEKAKHGHATNGSNAIPNPGAANGHSNGHTGAQFDTSQAALISTGFPSESANAGYDDSDFEDGDNSDAKPEAAIFAELAKRDRAGRVKLGLLTG